MIEYDVEITTEEGIMPAFAVHPENEGAFPAVILYMDAPGIREELWDFARRIAGEGYYCLLPDLYYRLGTLRFKWENGDKAVEDVVLWSMKSLTHSRVLSDTKGTLAFLDSHPGVRAGAKGCIGYCMSGRYVVSAAATFSEDFAAGASVYGVDIVTNQPDSPHLIVNRTKGELYFGFAERDEWVPDNVIPDLMAALDNSGVSYTMDVYPNTDHGFCFPRGAAYKKDAAEEVWKKIFELFGRRLG